MILSPDVVFLIITPLSYLSILVYPNQQQKIADKELKEKTEKIIKKLKKYKENKDKEQLEQIKKDIAKLNSYVTNLDSEENVNEDSVEETKLRLNHVNNATVNPYSIKDADMEFIDSEFGQEISKG